jgi:hypothetical protein
MEPELFTLDIRFSVLTGTALLSSMPFKLISTVCPSFSFFSFSCMLKSIYKLGQTQETLIHADENKEIIEMARGYTIKVAFSSLSFCEFSVNLSSSDFIATFSAFKESTLCASSSVSACMECCKALPQIKRSFRPKINMRLKIIKDHTRMSIPAFSTWTF